MTKQETTRIARVHRRGIATHEAGHFVMMWYLRRRPTGCIVYTNLHKNVGGSCYGDNKLMNAPDRALLSAAGHAANYAVSWKYSYLSLLFEIECLLKDTRKYDTAAKRNERGDLAGLWRASAGSKRDFARYVFTAVLIIKKHRGKVVQVRDMLLSRGRVTKCEAARFFKQWGDPDPCDIWRRESKAARETFTSIKNMFHN